MSDISPEQNEQHKIELEDQFILRLPPPQAEAVRNALKELKPKKFKKFLSLNLNKDKKEVRAGIVKVKKQQLHAKLVDLPCIVENYKTIDKAHIFKTADICQMLICQTEEFHSDDEDLTEQNDIKRKNKRYVYPHGIAPPLKNVRKQRFRKVLRNKDDLEEVTEIEKEVLWLLRADNEAVSTRFEVHYEKPTHATVNEYTIFGEVISDSDDSTQETPLSSAKTSASDLNETSKASISE